MMVLLVSECEKKALPRTRRVLDAFADRIGSNTWRTVITQDGLIALKKLLRKTASKSTAVSCHWIHGTSRSELLWIVGNRSKFNAEGIVAVNSTKRPVLSDAENHYWHYASSIQIVATLAALLHDLGKSTQGFQKKLRATSTQADPYRHEWLSLKLFEWLIAGCTDDDAWLTRFASIDVFLEQQAQADDAVIEKAISQNKDRTNIGDMPPLAQWVAWLIVTHHRQVPFEQVFHDANEKKRRQSPQYLGRNLDQFYRQIKAIDYWVKASPEKIRSQTLSQQRDYWQFKQLVIHSPNWQSGIKRWASKALADPTLNTLKNTCVDNPILLHLSRLALMMGDHNYSSLKPDDKRRVTGHKDFEVLAANTERETGKVKQPLDEHLLGVAQFTAKFSHHLPSLIQNLPTLRNKRSLERPAKIERFIWQNHAFKLAQQLQKDAQSEGFFGVNMASTGCGKTIGNARIMYGLADAKKGARFTIALGLRVLTLQTGKSLQHDLGLDSEELATLVGGSANKQLFELNQQAQDSTDSEYDPSTWGSESAERLVDELLADPIDYHDYQRLNLDTLIQDDTARQLLFSPVVSCTIDHIMQATECRRGGKYIAPLLRLLSSDLILDEPDDFDQGDLPALSRLVHLAGLMGSNVLLSSATLTPDMVSGLYQAYLQGRALYHQTHQRATPKVVCAWFDEQPKAMLSAVCATTDVFEQQHQKFISKRQRYLEGLPVRRQASIIDLPLSYNREKPFKFYEQLGQIILNGAQSLHRQYAITDSHSQKQISIGLVRLAHVKNIVGLARAITQPQAYDMPISEDVHIHLCCYHAAQLLVLRNQVEQQLDRILKRDPNDPNGLFQHTAIQTALAQSDAKQHIFIVLATPVAEVGRDHDYDWAIVEPSSMRSIIQLAGRVWRHRPDLVADQPNIYLLQKNLRACQGKSVVYCYPGFESQENLLKKHDLDQLMTPAQLSRVDAQPRIHRSATLDPQRNLADLEHQVLHQLLNPQFLNVVSSYWSQEASSNRIHTLLPSITPFRAQPNAQNEWIVVPDADDIQVYDAEEIKTQRGKRQGFEGATEQTTVRYQAWHSNQPNISPWLARSLHSALQDLHEALPDLSDRQMITRFSTVTLANGDAEKNGWNFNEWLGCWRC